MTRFQLSHLYGKLLIWCLKLTGFTEDFLGYNNVNIIFTYVFYLFYCFFDMLSMFLLWRKVKVQKQFFTDVWLIHMYTGNYYLYFSHICEEFLRIFHVCDEFLCVKITVQQCSITFTYLNHKRLSYSFR